jgi:hypothetical protein
MKRLGSLGREIRAARGKADGDQASAALPDAIE